MSDCCKMPNEQIISYMYIMVRTSYIQWNDHEVPPPSFVLEHAQLHCYSVNSLKQQSADRYVAPLRQIILISSQPVYALAS